jgi:hypothetical protein
MNTLKNVFAKSFTRAPRTVFANLFAPVTANLFANKHQLKPSKV